MTEELSTLDNEDVDALRFWRVRMVLISGRSETGASSWGSPEVTHLCFKSTDARSGVSCCEDWKTPVYDLNGGPCTCRSIFNQQPVFRQMPKIVLRLLCATNDALPNPPHHLEPRNPKPHAPTTLYHETPNVLQALPSLKRSSRISTASAGRIQNPPQPQRLQPQHQPTNEIHRPKRRR